MVDGFVRVGFETKPITRAQDGWICHVVNLISTSTFEVHQIRWSEGTSLLHVIIYVETVTTQFEPPAVKYLHLPTLPYFPLLPHRLGATPSGTHRCSSHPDTTSSDQTLGVAAQSPNRKHTILRRILNHAQIIPKQA